MPERPVPFAAADGATGTDVARALLEAGAVTVRPDEPVTFRSGLRSPVYVDNRRLIFHPGAWRVVVEALAVQVRSLRPPTEVVAGVESAGIPHSSAVAFATGLPSVFVRKEAKDHGLARRIEGGEVAGLRTVLVEDMVTTGGSSLSAVAALRAAGATVEVLPGHHHLRLPGGPAGIRGGRGRAHGPDHLRDRRRRGRLVGTPG